MSFVAKGFHVVKDLNPAALGSVLAIQGNGVLNDQGEIVGIATSAFPLLSSIRSNSRQPPARNKTPRQAQRLKSSISVGLAGSIGLESRWRDKIGLLHQIRLISKRPGN